MTTTTKETVADTYQEWREIIGSRIKTRIVPMGLPDTIHDGSSFTRTWEGHELVTPGVTIESPELDDLFPGMIVGKNDGVYWKATLFQATRHEFIYEIEQIDEETHRRERGRQ